MTSVGSLSSSGQYINIDALVQNAVRVQQQRVTDLSSQQGTLDSQISSLGQAKSQISSLEDKFNTITTALNSYNVTGAPSGLQITATTDGSYSLSVDRLASSQIVSGTNAIASGALGYSGTMMINTGTYDNSNNFSVNSSSTPITINSTDSLNDIVSKINSSGSGVNASIINGSDGQHLSLSNSKTGAINSFQIVTTDTSNSGIAALNYSQGVTGNYNTIQSAQDGLATINGIQVASSDNNFTPTSGLSFTANSVFSTENIVVKRDNSVLEKALSDFATSYNTTMTSLSGMNVDNSLKNLGYQVRSQLENTSYSNSISNLGLSFDKTGVLSFDNTQFSKYATNNQNLSQLINTNFSSISNAYKVLDTDVQTNGVIDTTTQNLQNQNNTLATSVSDAQTVLQSQTLSYQAQFAQLDQYIAQLNTESTNVAQLVKQFTGTTA